MYIYTFANKKLEEIFSILILNPTLSVIHTVTILPNKLMLPEIKRNNENN